MKKFDFGENIRIIREEKKLDLDFCSNYLKIHKKFLNAIEENNYKIFDNYFQAQGFVQNYLEFLELKPSEFMPRWRGDFYTEFDHVDEKTERFYKPKNKRILNFSVTLNNLLYGIFGIAIIGFLSFIGYQYNETLSSPQLEIFKPQTNDVVDIDLIDIFGKTDSDAVLKINNEKITIATDGNFSTSLKLAEGINTFKFTAINPYGKESVKILHIIYRPRKIEIYNPPLENTLEDSLNKATEPKNKTLSSPESTLATPKLTIPSTKPGSVVNIKRN